MGRRTFATLAFVEIDLSRAAPPISSELFSAWAGEQRIFISSTIADTRDLRRAAAATFERVGASPVWFEDFGGRDDEAEQAYLSEVDASTIYLAILNKRYGRRLRSGFSATEAEYRRALEGGKRISVWVAQDDTERDGSLINFIEDLRIFHVTGSFDDSEDFSSKLERRLRTLAAESVCPWVKLDEYVFRAEEIDHRSSEITLVAVIHPEIGRKIEALTQGWNRRSIRLAYGDVVVEAELDAVERTVRAGQPTQTTIRLVRPSSPRSDTMRAGTSGYSAEALVEVGLRHELFEEELPPSVANLPFLAETGIDHSALRTVFDLPNDIAEATARLVVSDGLVGSGHAAAIRTFRLGPKAQGRRRLFLEWEEPRVYTDVNPGRRQIEGGWRPAEA
jgi:hypothetical protein